MENNIRFVSTKLIMPQPRKNYISRVKLMEKLNNILDYKLSIIKGGAASGKTTLITSFVKENAFQNVKWISLDDGNNDLFSFWYYLLETVKNNLINSIEVLDFSKIMINKEDIEKLVTMLINNISVDEEIIIIMDDFHNITDRSLLQTIEYFIKFANDNVHFVLLTREEVPIYFGDLLMSDRMVLISDEELKFSEEESKTFINSTLKANFKDEQINKIIKLSEGWVGGLQLIVLASNNNNIGKINIINKYMIDYLSKEILTALKEEEREFLILTSILSYFDEEICNKLLNICNSEELISTLLERNLFLICIDEDKGIYRYHNIFNEFLKLEFLKRDNTDIKKMHYLAGEIYENIYDFEEGLKHFLSINEYEKAIKIIKRFEEEQKGWPFLINIPIEYVIENKDLMLQRLFHHFCNGESEKFDEAYKSIVGREDYLEIGKILKFTANLAFYNMDVEELLEFNLDAFSEIEKLNISNISKSILYLIIFPAFALSLSERYEDKKAILDILGNIEKKNKNPYLKYYALFQRAQIIEEFGDLIEAEKIYEQLFLMEKKYPILDKIKVSITLGIIGVYIKKFEIDKAKYYLNIIEKIIHKSFDIMEGAYLGNFIEFKIITGDNKDIRNIIDRLMIFDVYKQFAYYSGLMQLLMLSKNATEAEVDAFIKQCKSEKELFVRDKLIYAKALIIQKEKVEALRIVNEALEVLRKYCVKPRLIHALLIKTQILTEDGKQNQREIFNLLKEAIHYSYENRIIEPYILEGEGILSLLQILRNEKSIGLIKKEKDFLNEILSYIAKENKQDILSEREKEILKELATGATNKEISEALCISVATVKTHIINIYSKLGVKNRVEAADIYLKK